MDALLQGLVTVATNLLTSICNLISTQQNTNTHLQQIVAQPQVQGPATTTPSFELEAPAIYNGDVKRVTAFIQELEFYYALAHVTTIEQKVFFALGKIRGGPSDHATAWADSIHSNIINRRQQIEHITAKNALPNAKVEPIPDEYITTWIQFEQMFTQQFRLLDTQTREEAIETITQLEQGNMTCNEYSTVFNIHYQQSGYNEIAGLHEFKRGLNKGLRNKLETTFPLPENNADGPGTISFENWITRASDLDRQFRRARRYLHGPKTQAQRATPTGNRIYENKDKEMATPPVPTQQRDPNSMDIDRNRRSGILTCYHCQKKGHMARNCPDKDKPKVWSAKFTRMRALYGEMTEEEREQLKKDLGF